MNQARIYALEHPETRDVRYVGRTIHSLNYRHSQHAHEALEKERVTPIYSWWRSVASKTGRQPQPKMLERVPPENAASAETFWIYYLRFLGCRLLNMKDGRAGLDRKTARKIALERWKDPEYVQKQRKSQRGQTRSEEARRRISKARTGKCVGEENPFFGREHSDEAKEAIGRQSAVRNRALDFSTAEEIRNRYQKEDTTYKDLSDEYQVGPQVIGGIVRKETHLYPV